MPTFGGSFTGDSFIATKDSKSKGVELFTSFTPIDRLRLSGSFTYLDSKDTGFNGMQAHNIGETNVPVSPMQAALSVGWQATPKLDIHSFAAWEDGGERIRLAMVGPDLVKTETKEAAFIRWNLGANYQVNEHFKIVGKINNILDETDLSFSSTAVDSLGNVTETESKGADPGRFFSIGVEIRL